MKKIILPLFCVIAIASCSTGATSYNDKLAKEHQVVLDKMGELLAMDKDSASMQQVKTEAISLADACLSNIEKLSYSGDDKGFKSSIKEQVQYLKKFAAKDFDIMLAGKSASASATDIAKAKVILATFESEAGMQDTKIENAQKAFAKANNLEVEEE